MSVCVGQVVDTGLRSGPENLRLDRSQWRAAHRADVPNCDIRFHRYFPTVSLGAMETPGHTLRPEYCRNHEIDIVRRVSGGGAVYLDPGQLCWTLTFSRPRARTRLRLAEWMACLSEGVIKGLRELGVDAVFAPPNDIEVAGRKLASGFLMVSDSAVLFQGSLLLDLATETMMKALRVPTEKLSPEGIRTARHRFITLCDLGVELEPAAIQQQLLNGWREQLHLVSSQYPGAVPDRVGDDAGTPAEDWETDADTWYQALVKTRGGVLYARLRLNHDGRILQQAEFAGGLHVYPGHLFSALASWLAMSPVASLGNRLDDFFRAHPHDLLGFAIEDIRRVLYLALDRYAQQARFELTSAQANSLMVFAPQPQEAATIARGASVMLVPYCAKPSWCKWRHRDGCPECGRCEVGEAYRLARERRMRVVTITNFEHLEKTLGELRAQGTEAYVGMCCRHFYIKREYAFREAGIPAVLMDITGANCYELQQEDLAYAGQFKAEAHLDLAVLKKVMQRVPSVTEKSD